MYICTENYSERDYRTIGITTEIINKALNSEFRAFYIPTRMTHGLLRTNA
ncbi:MAG TPA: hypothetical protein PLS00_17770 [Niabella sp.]|nr:hypothetical protein [Niabella sp.]